MRQLVLNNTTSSSTFSSTERGIRIYPFELDWAFILTGYQGEAIEQLIQLKLDTFASQLGYPHGLTTTMVNNYIKVSARAFASARYLKSAYDATQFTDARGIKHPNLSKSYSLPIISLTNIEFSTELSAPAIQRTLPTISNYVWNEQMGRIMNLVRIPVQWTAIISYFHDNWFSNDSNNDDGISELFRFQPAILKDNPYLQMQDDLEELESVIASNPLLLEFLSQHMMLFEFASNFEWQRDQSGQSIAIVEDVELIYALETAFNVFYAGIKKVGHLLTHEYLYVPPHMKYSILDAPNVLSMDDEAYFYDMMFMDISDGNINQSGIYFGYTMFNSLSTAKRLVLPPGNIGQTQSFTFDTRRTIAASVQLFPLQIPFSATYYDNAITKIDANQSTVSVLPSPNLFFTNEDDFANLKREKFVELYFTVSDVYLTKPANPVIRTEGIGTVEVQRRDDDKPRQRKNTKNNSKKKKN